MPQLVALRFRDPSAMLRALDAAWAAGDAVLPLDPSAQDDVVAGHVARLRPAEVRDEDGTTSTGHDAPAPDGAALVVTTSGSTGVPRGVVLGHDALGAAVAASRARLDAADGVPWLGVLPLHHVAGISVVLRSRAAGREPQLHPRDSAAVVDAAEPSWISLVPTQLGRLLAAGADLARHHGVLLGGAAAPADLLERAAAAGVRVVTSYGATETCGGCVYDGRPLDGVEADVDDDGRIRLRGAVLAMGRRSADIDLEPVTGDDGWWVTSDLGRIEDGRLVVLGRADDVVVSGGANVPLGPVREMLARIQGPATAVVGLPDDRWGTAVTAVVEGGERTLSDLREALARVGVARRHLPTALVVVERLPTDRMGKVTPAAVQATLADGEGVVERLPSPDGRD